MKCLVCDFTTAEGLYLCERCHRRMAELLERVPATLGTARETLANMGVTPRVGSAGTSLPNEGAPVNLDMSERLGEFERRLVELACWVNEREEPRKLRIFTSPVRAAEYLRAVAHTLRKRKYVSDLYTELRDLERRVLSAADRPLTKRPLGECGALNLTEDNTVTRCVGTIMGHETATLGRCNTCHREHDATQRIQDRISNAWHHIAPLAVVVRALKEAGHNINYERAKKWAQRGKIAARCDTTTRQEGHTPAELLQALQTIAISTRNSSNR